jgi:aminopeptidase-like protein
MDLRHKIKALDLDQLGHDMYRQIERLYPVCRSITGEGVRETLSVISEIIPLNVHEIPSGTEVLDWEIPPEWNIKDAWIKNENGEKIIDFKQSNLHVLNYSIPVNKAVELNELKKHLFTLPEHPDWIPYRTSYHNRTWGFCMSDNQLSELEDGKYEVMVDATLEPGSLTYGEYLIKGKSADEVLVSCHICHPSLCNDNLSGIAVATELASFLTNIKNRYSYRFLFIPGTIGSITWLSLNEEKLNNIKHGLVLTLLGDNSTFYYKKSRRGNAEIDRIVKNVLKQSYPGSGIIDFYPYGYDERQFCSPAFNLPVGRISRKPHGEFPEYHTSADNLEFVNPARLAESLELILSVFDELEKTRTYLNLNPKGEPQLGKRGLFKKIGGQSDTKELQMALLWVLNMSDGSHSLEYIAEISGIELSVIENAANSLVKVELLEETTT